VWHTFNAITNDRHDSTFVCCTKSGYRPRGGDVATIGELETFKHKQNGLNIISRSTDQREAYSLAAMGDFDADGNDDFVIGYPSMSTNGVAFIVLGRNSSRFDPSSFISGSDGVKIVGAPTARTRE
jgi:hypothetical protein